MYLALDTVSEGRGLPGYPMPPDPSSPSSGTACPDEMAAITGLGCQKAWTITLALQVPEDGFDFRAQLQSQWPLATLWGDDRNMLEIYADSAAGKVGMRLTSAGSMVRTMTAPAAMLVRGTPFLLSVAQPAGVGGLEMTVAACGRDVTTIAMPSTSASVARMTVQPREIRFASPTPFPTSSGRGAAVSPLLVWGGQIDDRRALGRSEREKLLRSLSFLRPVP
jgi:hypothetical protein